ncbi:hypothetical protein ABBQ32_005843 [Trebouxia sp. C0010 RCD-2024]
MSTNESEVQALLQRTSRTNSEQPAALEFQNNDFHTEDHPLYAKLALYASHALSTWGQRMWEFAVGLIMLELYPSSLVLVSTFGLADGLAKVLSGSFVGGYIDKTARLKAACVMYILQNSAVALSAVTALVGLNLEPKSSAFWAAAFFTIGFGSASSVGAQGSALSVEKEWSTTLCYGDSAAMAKLNSGMRAIDLTCLLLSPIAAGFLMTYTSISTAILVITAWNLAAWAPECYLLLCAHRLSSVLRQPKQSSSKQEQTGFTSLLLFLREGGWAIYFKQSMWPAALALGLLYLTVLSLGLLMTAYLKWQGMTEAVLSVYRGAGAVSGLLATVAFPTFHRVADLKSTGLMGVWWQATALILAVAPVWLTQLGARLPESTTSNILLTGLVASRFGLWLFDLSVSQMLQEWIPADDIGEQLTCALL